MKKRWFIAVALIMSLLFSFVFAACGDDTSSEDDLPINSGQRPVKPNPKPDDGNDEIQEEEPLEGGLYKRVVVLGVDGGGAYFKQANTPNIDAIFQEGAVTYQCLTANPTISAQCWGSLLHGVTPKWHGLKNETVWNNPFPADSLFPSAFRVIHEQKPDAKLASFTHWNAINVGIVEENIGVHKDGGVDDYRLTDKICNYIKTNDPEFLFVQFDEVDEVGHSVGFGTSEQLNKITEIDAYIGKIYRTYEETGRLTNTLFIVTADHGGYGKDHGGLTDGEKYVMFAARGRTVQKKSVIEDIEIRDTAAIVLHALGLGDKLPETWTARVPSGLFEGVTAGARPVYEDPDSGRAHVSVPTPEKGSGKYITDFVDKPLDKYLTFDGNVSDACGGNTTSEGKLSFVDGYFGQGVALDNGYVSIPDYVPGKKSFSISLWIKSEGVGSDPAIVSNKDWANGSNAGFVLAFREADIKFNAGDGSSRMDVEYTLPSDFAQGWMHVLLVVDRTAGEIRFCYDFGEMQTSKIPASLQDADFGAFDCLNIGQDGTGMMGSLPAAIDEFMLFDGALTQSDVAKLAEYYGTQK